MRPEKALKLPEGTGVYGLTYFTVSPQTLFELALHEWITTSTTILDFISEVDHPLM